MLNPDEKNKTALPKEDSTTAKKPARYELTAFAFDRDKNVFYLASDESVDEILDSDGYHVIHPNRDMSKKDSDG
jgi:hypothetical protein